MLVRAIQVNKYFGGNLVFDNLDFEIKRGDKIALIGENGSGKSTLFKILAGKQPPDSGTVVIPRGTSIDYLEQEPQANPDDTVLDMVMSADPKIVSLHKQLQELEAHMGDPAVTADPAQFQNILDKYGLIQEQFDRSGGYNYEAKIKSVLKGIGFSEEQLSQPATKLSGGEKKLIGLAQLLVKEPDLLLLDEPDNHLDIKAKDWLEQYIMSHDGAVATISHDRYFLDRFINHIFELEDGKIYEYHCNYSGFREAKQRRLEKEAQLYEMQKRELKELEKTARRLKLWASLNLKFAGRAQSKKRQLNARKAELENTPKPTLNRNTVELEFGQEERSGKIALRLKAVAMTYGTRQLYAPFDLSIHYGERIGLVGPNGSGKTALFKLILGEEIPTTGTVQLGARVKVGYYSQEQETLDLRQTPVDYVRSIQPMIDEKAVALLKGRLLLDYDECFTPIGNLSGGQKSRLQLVGLGLKGINFLLLDEPTNNLDIPSMIVLEDALIDFEGTILVISHDRYFLDQVVDKIVAIENGQIKEYLGNFTDFYERTAGKIDLGTLNMPKRKS
ncbi:MAG: ABC-F family ATP-binding cassette domain-containing protein [Chloroflexi bacterium]|uniref:ATP-binding cassette domain-containing protein n=1 Tax=Candidatus Chlorohelix allophototropha TaxID=3003348 RepID=A0A8T7MAL8_9CHLR|nr:ABC-F family ATP-binding cassette domain-containing protein [Chloroflexota bacterium]WJW66118.1 ATP-binding cassette domain-containing protein [Chloroflexota bacterium L227-S17]